jgi:ArsR family transcriptional regulator
MARKKSRRGRESARAGSENSRPSGRGAPCRRWLHAGAASAVVPAAVTITLNWNMVVHKEEELTLSFAAAAVAVAPMVRLFAALGDDVRLRMIALLTHGELCVCHIEEALDLKQANASRHLAILRAAGVVTSRREDRWVYYQLARQTDPDCKRHMKALTAAFATKEVLRKDVERLLKVKRPGRCK